MLVSIYSNSSEDDDEDKLLSVNFSLTNTSQWEQRLSPEGLFDDIREVIVEEKQRKVSLCTCFCWEFPPPIVFKFICLLSQFLLCWNVRFEMFFYSSQVLFSCTFYVLWVVFLIFVVVSNLFWLYSCFIKLYWFSLLFCFCYLYGVFLASGCFVAYCCSLAFFRVVFLLCVIDFQNLVVVF